MAALVQTIPQHTSTVPVLQTRPSSSSGTFASSSQIQASRYQNMSWSSLNAGNSGSYRTGQPIVAPYAFASNLGHPSSPQQHRQSWSPHLRPEHRTSSAPTVAQGPMMPYGATPRVAHPAAGSVSNTSSSTPSFHSYVSKDDSAIPSRKLRGDQPLRPLSTANLPTPSIMNISSPAGSAKPSPNRYRRPQRAEGARDQSPAPVPASASASASPAEEKTAPIFPVRPALRPTHSRVSSVDGVSHAEKVAPERYRRRSLGNMDSAAIPNLQLPLPTPTSSSPQPGSYDFISFDSNPRPHSSHSRRDSSGSIHSRRSSGSSARAGSPDSSSVTSKTGKPDEKRTSKPSPLSQPAATSHDAPTSGPEATHFTPSSPPLDSPAAKRLAELKNVANRPGKSRLRRAFSFGSASELLKNSGESRAAKREALAAEKLRQEALLEELGPEQAAIAMQQEESGLGESIYSHQGGLFSRSTDALSVSSTASSASMMLRKMGKGMKKGGRSLVGMFRTKSVASIKSIEGAAEPIAAPQITVVNVERDNGETVAVNPDPQEMPRGGTVFPETRKSIVGSDRERAEILAAVRKGILKKTHSDFGISSPAHTLVADSPHSSAPTTPDESTRPRPNDHVKIEGEDYFIAEGGRYTGTDAKSAPITPSGVGRNIAFSPRIQFHDTWPPGEYDRRGDIATCNRLTPLLAQQIREEINNFKMEMEVHENSKIYTHFI
ncbi:uncharacterized protein N7477_002151 [Penicillium maclennaniae]|uniref:uncharacterized protein n=1 Tax=Penicillium maclennaniae TaxID=1343394 RepID=UPI002540F18F|nr:uncharacterized protein N7477_002151 [Penicillium maclennaniae]KAJ5676518.1 hypothetical protein N7477_002151 [Penicillium maclennaniae]